MIDRLGHEKVPTGKQDDVQNDTRIISSLVDSSAIDKLMNNTVSLDARSILDFI
jgi:hypothetical protein